MLGVERVGVKMVLQEKGLVLTQVLMAGVEMGLHERH